LLTKSIYSKQSNTLRTHARKQQAAVIFSF